VNNANVVLDPVSPDCGYFAGGLKAQATKKDTGTVADTVEWLDRGVQMGAAACNKERSNRLKRELVEGSSSCKMTWMSEAETRDKAKRLGEELACGCNCAVNDARSWTVPPTM